MKKISGLIDSLLISVGVLETEYEFSEGARLSNGISDNNGLFFQFGYSTHLSFENSGVEESLTVLFFSDLVNNMGVVSEAKTLLANSADVVTSVGTYPYALELPTSFCTKNRIGVGSILTLYTDTEEDTND